MAIELFEEIMLFLLPYTKIVSLTAGILGEDLVMLLAVLSGAGSIPLWAVSLFGFIGVMIHDSLVFYISRSSPAHYIKNKLKLSKNTSSLVIFIEKIAGKTYFFPLLLSKFIYGTRLAFIVFVSHKEGNFLKYSIKNALAVLIWFSIMIPLGWLAGKGFSDLLIYAKGIEKGLAFIVIAIIVSYLVKKLFASLLKSDVNSGSSQSLKASYQNHP